MRLLLLPAALSALVLGTAIPLSLDTPHPLPLLIWHGLGDRHDAEGLHSVGDLAKQIHPGTHVHYIKLEDSGASDRTATFYGNVTEQIAQVCESLHADKKLRKRSLEATGQGDRLYVDALGFSQGGQFLRGLLQRCDGLAFRSLVTFGSQHNGIAEVKSCGQWDLLCKGAISLMKNNAWTEYVQSHVVPAQYYRTLNESTGLASEEYLEYSNFLADVNNEREVKNETYKERLVKGITSKFVMFVFEDDTTVIPKESGWFDEVINATSEEGRTVVPLRKRKMYTEDWIGLKQLDEKKKLVFKIHPGDHMQLEEEILAETFAEYFGPTSEGDNVRPVFRCTEYNPGWLWGWRFQIEQAWEHRHDFVAYWTRGWKGSMYKQGL